jgi:hypothetical protein
MEPKDANPVHDKQEGTTVSVWRWPCENHFLWAILFSTDNRITCDYLSLAVTTGSQASPASVTPTCEGTDTNDFITEAAAKAWDEANMGSQISELPDFVLE